MTFLPEIIYLERAAADSPLAQKVLERFPETPVQWDRTPEEALADLRRTEPDVFGAAKRRLMLSRFKGSFLKKCPGVSPGMVCCNYFIVNLIKNCVYDCSYCFLQDFLNNNPLLHAYVNIEDLLNELEEVFTAHPDRVFRVGTGELTDSLALDDVLPYSQWLIPWFNNWPNARLELKTKSDRVDHLPAQPDGSNTIISWSLNPAEIAEHEEKGTPGVDLRLEAARRCQEKGYRTGFHFDPVILFPGWEEAYRKLIDRMFETVSPRRVEWISLGGFRYRPSLKPVIRERHPGTRLFTQEHTPSRDGKFRYLRPLRNHAFDTLRRLLTAKSDALSVYLCMETKEVWEGVTGKAPRSDSRLDQFFDF